MDQTDENVFDFFTNIQVAILSMSTDEQINLLNDCFSALSKVNESDKSFSKQIIPFINSESCILDKDSLDLFKFFVEIYDIDKKNFLLESIQSGGEGEDNQQMVVAPSQKETTPQAVNKNNNIPIVNPPINPITEQAQLVVALGNAGITPDQIVALLNQSLQNQAIALKNQSIIPTMEANDAYFVRNLHRFNLFFSFTSPAALLYFLNSMLQRVATFTVKSTNTVVSGTVGGVELGVRNAIPTVLNAAISTGKMFKDYIPDSLKDTIRGALNPLRSSGITDYASESISGTITEGVFTGIQTGTEETLIVGCILFYIILACMIALFTTLLLQLYKAKNFKAFISLPFGMGAIGFQGGKTKKNRRNKSKGKGKAKKTHKRRK